MTCSTCGHDVDEYYRGRQCKLCFRKPQKAWRKRNRNKEREAKNRRYNKDPQLFIAAIAKWRAKNSVYYGIHIKLRQRYDTIHLKDTYIRKRIRQSVGPTHTITDQEIDDRRKQIIRFRRKREIRQIKREYTVSMLICPIVKREIPAETCQNMQIHYDYEACQGCDYQTSKLNLPKGATNLTV